MVKASVIGLAYAAATPPTAASTTIQPAMTSGQRR